MDETIRKALDLVVVKHQDYQRKGAPIIKEFRKFLEGRCLEFKKLGCQGGVVLDLNSDLRSKENLLEIRIGGPLYGTPTLPRTTWFLSKIKATEIFGSSPDLPSIINLFKSCFQECQAKDYNDQNWKYRISDEHFGAKVKKHYDRHLREEERRKFDAKEELKRQREQKVLERQAVLAEYRLLLENRSCSFQSVVAQFIEWLIPQLKVISREYQEVSLGIDLTSFQFQIRQDFHYSNLIKTWNLPDVVIGLLKTKPDLVSSDNYQQEGVFQLEMRTVMSKALVARFPTMAYHFDQALNWRNDNDNELHKELYQNYHRQQELKAWRYQESVDGCTREVSAVVASQLKNEESIKKDVTARLRSLVVDFASEGYREVKILLDHPDFSAKSLDAKKTKTFPLLQFIPSVAKPISEVCGRTMFHAIGAKKVIPKLLYPLIITITEACFPQGFLKIDEATFQITF